MLLAGKVERKNHGKINHIQNEIFRKAFDETVFDNSLLYADGRRYDNIRGNGS